MRKVAWLLLDYKPVPPPAAGPGSSDHHQVPWRRWLASAGGLGGLQTYPHGVLYGLLLLTALTWTSNFDRNDDGSWLVVVLLTLPYCALSGYLAGRRTRSIWAGTATGAVAAGVGSVITLAAFVVLTRNVLYVAVAPFALPITGLGLIFGAIGGALSQPRMAVVALRSGFKGIIS